MFLRQSFSPSVRQLGMTKHLLFFSFCNIAFQFDEYANSELRNENRKKQTKKTSIIRVETSWSKHKEFDHERHHRERKQ